MSRLTCVGIGDLAGRTLALLDLEPSVTDSMVRALVLPDSQVKVRFVDELMRVFELVNLGKAVGLTCRNHVEAIRDTNVVGIPFDLLELTYFLCSRTDRLPGASDSAFIDFVMSRGRFI